MPSENEGEPAWEVKRVLLASGDEGDPYWVGTALAFQLYCRYNGSAAVRVGLLARFWRAGPVTEDGIREAPPGGRLESTKPCQYWCCSSSGGMPGLHGLRGAGKHTRLFPDLPAGLLGHRIGASCIGGDHRGDVHGSCLAHKCSAADNHGARDNHGGTDCR